MLFRQIRTVPVNLLPEEDVHWLEVTHLFEPLCHLEWDVVVGQLVQHVIAEAIDNGLPGFTSPATAVLWLDTQNGVQDCRGCLCLVSRE